MTETWATQVYRENLAPMANPVSMVPMVSPASRGSKVRKEFPACKVPLVLPVRLVRKVWRVS